MNRDTDDKTNDAQGHMPRVKWVDEAGTEANDDADTEGNAIRVRGVDDAAPEDDTEGHKKNFRS